MDEHYYSRQPAAKSEPQSWQETVRGHTFQWTTDRGVFSKKSLDFGTKFLLETFEFPSAPGDLLDLGCGYGPIGLVLAKEEPGRRVVMVDVNERALALARQNASQNGVENVEVIESDGYEKLENRSFAAVVTNPPIRAGKKVVYRLFEDTAKHLLPGGEFWVVIQKKQGAPSAVDKLRQLFPEVAVRNRKKGYFVICARH